MAAKNGVLLMPGKPMRGFEFAVPGDISSTAFFLVAGALLPGTGVIARDLNVNPTRTGILDVLSSDYVPVSLMHAAFMLSRDGIGLGRSGHGSRTPAADCSIWSRIRRVRRPPRRLRWR